LNGLEGTWTADFTLSGTITTPEGDMEYSESFNETWFITTNSIISYDSLIWNYNGEVLMADLNYNFYGFDESCGIGEISIATKIQIKIKPNSSNGNICGIAQFNFWTDICGYASGILDITGNLTKN